MNRYFAERFQDITDALPSASPDTLVAIKLELQRLVEEVQARLDEEPVNDESVRVTSATVHSFNSAGNG